MTSSKNVGSNNNEELILFCLQARDFIILGTPIIVGMKTDPMLRAFAERLRKSGKIRK
jgi:hypothetical protein